MRAADDLLERLESLSPTGVSRPGRIEPVFEDLTRAACAETVPIPVTPQDRFLCVMPFAIHDGWVVPQSPDPSSGPEPGTWPDRAREYCVERYAPERDWGASAVAYAIAHHLGLPSIFRVRLARCVLDWGRFPDFTWHAGAEHLQRRALDHRLADEAARHPQLTGLLRYYDQISAAWEQAIDTRLAAMRGDARPSPDGLILLGIHTYDATGEDPHKRPVACVLYRTEPRPDTELLPVDLFDPLFPRRLVDFTADRLLANRIAVELERDRVPVAHHEVYHLPPGSVEVRTQVWFFFHSLRRRLLDAADAPREIKAAAANDELWSILLAVNGRDSTAVAKRRWMRGTGDGAWGGNVRSDYRTLRAYMVDNQDLVHEYQNSAQRPSSLAIEIRKDVLVGGPPQAPVTRVRNVERIAALIAEGIRKYLDRDLVAKASSEPRWWDEVGSD